MSAEITINVNIPDDLVNQLKKAYFDKNACDVSLPHEALVYVISKETLTKIIHACARRGTLPPLYFTVNEYTHDMDRLVELLEQEERSPSTLGQVYKVH